MYKAHANDSARAHRQYWINKINFITDYDVLQSSAMSSVDINDSVHYKGYPIYYKDKLYLRPKFLRITFGLLPATCIMSAMCSRPILVLDVYRH